MLNVYYYQLIEKEISAQSTKKEKWVGYMMRQSLYIWQKQDQTFLLSCTWWQEYEIWNNIIYIL